MSAAPRRRWLGAAGVAAAAAGLGVGSYLWRRGEQQPAAAQAFWTLELETPLSTRLRMATLRGRPLVVNFWATWCPPCVREMPALDRFFREHAERGWQVLGLAADNRAAVKDFLVRTPVAFPIVMAGFEGVDLSRRLGNDSGALPFSVLFGGDGRIVRRHVGETRYEQLVAWTKGIS